MRGNMKNIKVKGILRLCLGILIATELFIQFLIFIKGVPEASDPGFQQFQQHVPIPYFVIQNFTMYLLIILIAQVILYIYLGSWEKMGLIKRFLLTLLAIAPLFWLWQLIISLIWTISTIAFAIAIVFIIIILVILALFSGSGADANKKYQPVMREAQKDAEVQSLRGENARLQGEIANLRNDMKLNDIKKL